MFDPEDSENVISLAAARQAREELNQRRSDEDWVKDMLTLDPSYVDAVCHARGEVILDLDTAVRMSPDCARELAFSLIVAADAEDEAREKLERGELSE